MKDRMVHDKSPNPGGSAGVMVAARRPATSSRQDSVVLRLRPLEAFGIELLHGVCGTRNE
jgi:hypothetical protein